MATEQVLAWINNDLTLSQSVANFETDFSNGYLLGEILNHYGCTEMHSFSKKKNKEAKVNNFYLVENCLRKLNVRFDGKLIHQIMEEERGASLRLLYQIKLACSKLNVPKNDPDELTTTGLKAAKMHTILSNKREATMEMSKTIPPPTVGGKDIRTSKQKLADLRTIGYDVAQKTLFDSALAAHQAEMDLIKSITQEQRTTNMQKLMENQTFMKEWIQEGKQNWRKNQQKRAEAIAKVKYFEDREVNIYKTKLENELIAATQEEINGISDFDKNLQKLGIQQGISMEEAIKKQEEKKGIPPGQIQNFSYAATMNKIKETKKNSDFAGKERDRRRRKMIVDQQNAQTKLDQEAREEALISKLLAQTSEEQRDAFIDERMAKCKQNEFQKRQAVAVELEQKREQQNRKSELKRQGTFKGLEQDRARKNEIKRQEAKKAAFGKKMEKRGVNIEIASGLVDLLIDLADETFEVVSQSETHQIPNPEWRNFISIFKAGKKVSLRNVTQAPAASNDSSNKEALLIPEDTQAHDMQKKFWSDPSLLNLYEYLSGSGAFNIPQLAPEMWQQYQEQYANLKTEQLESVPFIDVKMQENGRLVELIDSLYKQALHPSATEDLKIEGCSLLKQPTIKLALVGRAYSGKKTIASQLKEVLGNDVAIMNLDDIIKEAIEYITPKKQDESVTVDPKAKGKKGAKEEPVHVDIFEGKNSAQYKSYAQQIKDLYFSGETLPRKVDLAEFILDDQLLNGLVIERLKLQTEGKSPLNDDQIKAGVAREKEICKQLEELDAQAALLAADPKAKPAKPAKGAPNPDQLRAELDEIKSFKAQGWILIGYPQQLSQIKLLEQEMTGFTASIDQLKSERVEVRESWTKLTLDSKDIEVSLPSQQTVASGFDSVIFIETPESECLKRAEGKEDEAGNESRIKTINENFDRKVGSLKKWCEQFGLIDSDGRCQVTLNQEVCSTEWDSDTVKESAIATLKKVIAFKQDQFNAQRQSFKDQLDQTIEVGEQPATPIKSQKSQKSLKPNSQLNSPGVSQIQLDEQSHHEMEKTKSVMLDTKSNLDTQTNKSSRRTKQVNQQRYEINEAQKIQKWEHMLNDYYRNSLQQFNDLVKQRKRIFGLFDQTQSNFINFVCREAPYQKRVNEFCDNYNRFSEQYPELRGKDETRTELLKRVTILNESLWQTILDRKTQAVEEHKNQETLMLQGWDTREKSKLVSSIAQLIENEFERFRAVVRVVTGWVVNQDIDLKSLCNKLDERATSTYENGVSPMLDQVVVYVHSCISQLVQEPFVQQLSPELLEIVYKEKANFHMRCNTLKQYALLLLLEINDNTSEISEAFEQWIIVAVKKENAVASGVIKQIKQSVEKDQSYLNNIRVLATDLEGSIQRVQLEEGQPKYSLATLQSPRGMAETRIDISNLKHIFALFKQNAYEELLDSQTFLTLLIGFYQADRLPQIWRNMPFQSMLELLQKFAASPLTNDGDSGKSLFGSQGERVQYVNWKKVFLLMALACSKIPDDDTLQSYGSDLAYYGSLISLDNFINADSWFDQTESALTPSQMLKASSTLTSPRSHVEEEVFDQERLDELKELLWRTVKRTNEEGLRCQDLIQVLGELKSMCSGSEQTFGDLL